MPLLVLLSDSTTSQPDYSLANLVLMAVYVSLTLALAIVAIVSLVPDKEENILFSLDHSEAVFPYNVFEEYNVF